MFAITVVVQSAMFQLLYKTEAKARETDRILTFDPAQAGSSLNYVRVSDDFGQEFCCYRDKLSGYIFEDMEKTKLAHVERALHQSRVQALASKAASADPGLRMHQQMNGPGMLSPFMGPRGN